MWVWESGFPEYGAECNLRRQAVETFFPSRLYASIRIIGKESKSGGAGVSPFTRPATLFHGLAFFASRICGLNSNENECLRRFTAGAKKQGGRVSIDQKEVCSVLGGLRIRQARQQRLHGQTTGIRALNNRDRWLEQGIRILARSTLVGRLAADQEQGNS